MICLCPPECSIFCTNTTRQGNTTKSGDYLSVSNGKSVGVVILKGFALAKTLYSPFESLLSVCACLWNVHCAPLQWHRAMLCTTNLRCAPPTYVVHHGAQGRPYVSKMSSFWAIRTAVVHNAARSVCLKLRFWDAVRQFMCNLLWLCTLCAVKFEAFHGKLFVKYRSQLLFDSDIRKQFNSIRNHSISKDDNWYLNWQ